MDADRTRTSRQDPQRASAAPHRAEVSQPRRMDAQVDRAVTDLLRGNDIAAPGSAQAPGSAPAGVSLSAKAVRLARRYRYATVGITGGSVMPWPDVMYRLQAWHGVRTTIAELRAALDQD